MLAERRSALLANEQKWKEKSASPAKLDISVSSLAARKSALFQATDGWKSRVQTDDAVNALNASYRFQKAHVLTPRTPKSQTEVVSPAPASSGKEAGKVRSLARAAILIRPKSPEVRCENDSETGENGVIPRHQPMVGTVRRTRVPGARRLPSSLAALSVDTIASPTNTCGSSFSSDFSTSPSSSCSREAKSSPDSNKENSSSAVSIPARSPQLPSAPADDRTPKLGVKNCGIVLKRPDTARPYPEVMLVRCIGSKFVDVRVVAPSAASVHECATFVLITAERLCVFEGAFSSLLERTRAKQIAHAVMANRDLSCNASKLELVKEDARAAHAFWRFLGGEPETVAQVPPEMEAYVGGEGSECFGTALCRCNVVYEWAEGTEVPHIVVQGEPPHSKVLHSDKIFIFDFGTEIYTWIGHDADRAHVKSAMEFAEKLCESALAADLLSSSQQSSYSPHDRRPAWVVVRKLTEGLPDCLFRLKFLDPLPEPTPKTPKTPRFSTPRITFAQPRFQRPTPVPQCGLEELLKDEDTLVEQLAQRLAAEEPRPHVLELEETELRAEDENVFTEGLTYFRLEGEELCQVEELAEFYDHDCYVIKWLYRVERTGVRRLDGSAVSQKDTGRQRTAYFYWFGRASSKKAQGSCALALRRLDKDRREHVLMEQGHEVPLFLHLFHGQLVISSGDWSEADRRVYIVHGSSDAYFYAEEIECDERQAFRPQAAYVLVNAASRSVAVWKGSLASKPIAQAAARLADKIAALRCFSVTACGKPANVTEPSDWRHAPKIIRLFDTEGELLQPVQYARNVNFTFRQEDLKETLLVDQESRLWIWTDVLAKTFHLQVAAHYWKLKNRREKPAVLICRGKEPSEFRALFPTWNEWPEAERTEEDEFVPADPVPLADILHERTRFRSIEEVRQRRLPPGCDTKRLEKFLNDEDFREVFDMDRDAFYALPKWKQTVTKKQVNLF